MTKALEYYSKKYIMRYDLDKAVPYLTYHDFDNLKEEKHTFINSHHTKIAYFFYYFDNYQKDKIIIFLPGVGPGRRAYLSEIATLCKHGYKVLTLDYTGCNESEGETMIAFNEPSLDAHELLNTLNLKEEISVVGHSLGGYSAINILYLHPEITKGVLISPPLSTRLLFEQYKDAVDYLEEILNYEKEKCPLVTNYDTLDFLNHTKAKLMIIASKDDPLVDYNTHALAFKEKCTNENIKFLLVDKKKHNPNYTLNAVNYMNSTLVQYWKLVKNGTLDTLEKQKAYMADKDVFKMVEQDSIIWKQIFAMLDEEIK